MSPGRGTDGSGDQGPNSQQKKGIDREGIRTLQNTEHHCHLSRPQRGSGTAPKPRRRAARENVADGGTGQPAPLPTGSFVALCEENLLAGRYVITTSLSEKAASTAKVVVHYKSLHSVERRFRVLKDFLALRPVFRYTEERARGLVAICVLARR